MSAEKNISILLVEDEENLHEALKLNLELEGFNVTSAYDGAAALNAVAAEYFDLIILDVMLPEMDGITVAETVRISNNEVPILILSARNSSADRVLGLKKGADDYLTKPFNLEELLLRVHKLIDKNKKLLDKSSIGNSYSFGNNLIDFKAQEASTKAGQKIQLSKIRGSVDCGISLKDTGNAKPVTINTDLAKAYYKPLAELSAALKLDPSHILSTLVKLPEVITPSSETLTDAEWADFKNILLTAIENLNNHRLNEGRSLEKDLTTRIANIITQQNEVKKLEPLRQQKIREGITRLLEENVGKENYDGNRLEQELIYYIEKIDISEEQVRLKNHCDYFQSLLNEVEESKGKKLSFILQEIGREINTTGSKAYDATIQKCVVLMKDELEKAKEQVLNVL